MKTSGPALITVGIACCGASWSNARVMAKVTYQELLDRSDLVVIAAPTVKTTDTNEKSFFPNIFTQHPDGTKSPIESIGVQTPFEVSAVLKGEKSIQSFVLHHYREASSTVAMDGPVLVFFDPTDMSKRSSYLLFLVREPDGRYAPTAGQTDPGLMGIVRVPFDGH